MGCAQKRSPIFFISAAGDSWRHVRLRPKEKKGRRSAQNISSPTPHFLLAKMEGGVKKKEERACLGDFRKGVTRFRKKIRNFVEVGEKVLLSFPDFLTLNCFRQKGGKERKLIVSRIFLSKKRAPPSSSLFPLIFSPRVRCQSHGKNLTSPLFPPPRSWFMELSWAQKFLVFPEKTKAGSKLVGVLHHLCLEKQTEPNIIWKGERMCRRHKQGVRASPHQDRSKEVGVTLECPCDLSFDEKYE